MSVLLVITFLGLWISLISHALMLFKMSVNSSHIAVALNVGLILTTLIRILVTKGLRRGDNYFISDSIKNICPYKFKVVVYIFMAYGIIAGIISLIGMSFYLSVSMTEADYIICIRRLFIGVFSFLMACYALEFMITLSYWILSRKKH